MADHTTAGIDLDKLEALARAATPGPWDVNQASAMKNGRLVVDELYVYSPKARNVAIAADIADPATGDMSKTNADFIAAANPTTVLQLILLARRSTSGSDEHPMTYDEFFAEAKRLGCKLPPELLLPASGSDEPPGCGWCNDAGILGSPPDRYEDCPYCGHAQQASGSDGTAAAGAAAMPFRERFADAYLSLSVAHFNSPFWNQNMEKLLIAVDAEINKRVDDRVAATSGSELADVFKECQSIRQNGETFEFRAGANACLNVVRAALAQQAGAPAEYVGKLRATLYAIANTLDDSELRSAAKEAYAAPAPAAHSEREAKDAAPVISSYDLAKVKALKFKFVDSMIRSGIQYRTCGGISAVLNQIIDDSEATAKADRAAAKGTAGQDGAA